MQIPTVEQVRESLAFRNITTAMDRAFPEGWMVDGIHPEAPGLDFVVRFTVRGYSTPVYLSVSDTYIYGMRLPGTIAVCVPWAGPEYWRTPDGTHARGVDFLIGTAQEKDRFYSGVSGEAVDDIEAFLGLLRRYLDAPVEYEKPTVEQVRQSVAFNNVVAAMGRVFPGRSMVEDIFPNGSNLDFIARFSVTGYTSKIYIKAMSTSTSPKHGSGLGGRIHISVPWGGDKGYPAPDGTHVISVKTLIGTGDEKRAFMFGADGNDADDIEAYLRFLKRYLDGNTGNGENSPDVATNTPA